MQIACIGLSVMDLLVGVIEKVMNINQISQQDEGKVTLSTVSGTLGWRTVSELESQRMMQ